MIQIKEYPYDRYKVSSVSGRYLPYSNVISAVRKLVDDSELQWVGTSVDGHDIPLITLGNGPKVLLMWSQMHGNESTTTKALLDYISFLKTSDEAAKRVLEQCTLHMIPILNPDGANNYTRVNSNQVDLNRDAQELSQPESKTLRSVFNRVKPHYCFNLHDQRTLFNVGKTDRVATVSFLSPAADEQRSLTESRIKSMQIISDMNDVLQQYIPGGVGRYDDSFNLNCSGDTFQNLKVPTILFESGHYPGDYQREETRKLVNLAIYTAVNSIVYELYDLNDTKAYRKIPENGKLFYDVIIRNPQLIDSGITADKMLGINYEERLEKDKIVFVPKAFEVVPMDSFYGHKTYDLILEEDKEEVLLKKLLIHT